MRFWIREDQVLVEAENAEEEALAEKLFEGVVVSKQKIMCG